MALRHLMQGCTYVGGKLEFEQVVGAVALLLVPAHDRIVPQTEIAAIEPDALLVTEPATGILHRLLPLGRRHRIATTKPIRRTKPCA